MFKNKTAYQYFFYHIYQVTIRKEKLFKNQVQISKGIQIAFCLNKIKVALDCIAETHS